MKRNVTDEEIGLTVKKGCYLLPLEEWQVNSKPWSHVFEQVNDTFRNGSILHLETKQLFELGEYEMYRMEGLTRQGDGGGIFLGIGCAAIPSRGKRLSPLTGSKDICPHIYPHLGWASIFANFVCVSSLVCLFLHMFLYCWLKKLRNQPSQILLSLVVALFFGQLLFFFGFNFTKSKTICIFIASVTHYSFLVAFFCMNVMGFDLCRTFFNSVHLSRNRNRSLITEANTCSGLNCTVTTHGDYLWL